MNKKEVPAWSIKDVSYERTVSPLTFGPPTAVVVGHTSLGYKKKTWSQAEVHKKLLWSYCLLVRLRPRDHCFQSPFLFASWFLGVTSSSGCRTWLFFRYIGQYSIFMKRHRYTICSATCEWFPSCRLPEHIMFHLTLHRSDPRQVSWSYCKCLCNLAQLLLPSIKRFVSCGFFLFALWYLQQRQYT